VSIILASVFDFFILQVYKRKNKNYCIFFKVYKDIHVILKEKKVDDISQLDATDQSALRE
jgi:hypothetical protein